MAGCKRNTITIQYMLEVPNLQFVETRYYFDGQWRIGSRLREKDDELLDVGKVYTDSIINGYEFLRVVFLDFGKSPSFLYA